MASRRWIRQGVLLLSAAIVLIAVTAAILLFRADHYVFLYSGDGSAHLVLSRLLFDSQTPIVRGVGTAWLPFFHLLLSLPSLINPLFYSGIAGLVVGIPSLVGSAVLLFFLILRITRNLPAAFSAALLFALNPNVMYLAFTPLTESLFLFLIIASAYSFLRWFQTGRRGWLTRTAVIVALSTLTRYEAWVLPSLVIAAVAVQYYRGGIEKKDGIALLRVAVLSTLGIMVWLTWNWWRYDNPLIFAFQIHGAGYAAVRSALAYHPWTVLDVYLSTVLHMFGPLLLVLAAAGLFLFVHERLHKNYGLPLFFLLFPPLFALISLFLGFAQMDKYWWNSRYVVTLALPLWVGAGVALARLWSSRGGTLAAATVMAGLLLFSVFQLREPEVDVVTYRDAVQNFFDRTTLATEVGECLGKEYRGGSIALVTGSVQGQRIMLPARIPLRQYYMPFGYPPDSVCSDLSVYRYIVLAKRPTEDAGPNWSYWTERLTSLYGYYDVLLENGDFLLLRRHHDIQSEEKQTVGWHALP